MTDPLNQATQYQYNLFGRPVKVIDAEQGETMFSYDVVGNLLTVTDPLNNTTTFAYAYDDNGNHDGERWERGNAGDHIALTFDGNGDLTNRYLHGPAVDQILAALVTFERQTFARVQL